MPQLAPPDFADKWIPLLADNVFQNIDGPLLARFVTDLTDSFSASSATANVPDWMANTYYPQDFVILFSGYQDFFKAKQAGYLPAPTDPVSDDNWLVALKPAAPQALYQQASLEAMRHSQSFWVPNRLYVIVKRVDPATGQALPDVYVQALAENKLEPEAWTMDATALVPTPVRVRYDLDTDTAGPVPPAIDAYTKTQTTALLNQRAILVNGQVPEYQLPARAIGNVDLRNRFGSNGGTIVITGGSYWHVAGEVTLDLRNLAQPDVFFLRISSFASAVVWTRLLATDGKVIGAYPQGTALTFRRNGTGPSDLAVVTVSSEYPSYAHAFVPLAIESAVAGGDWDASNRLAVTPAGSVATMQFFDESYLYFCFLDEQVQNGVLTYAWFRQPRTGSLGGGGGGGASYTDAQAKAAALASLIAGNGQHQGVQVSSVNGVPKLSVSGTETLSIIHFQAQNVAGNAYSDLELFATYRLDVLDGLYNLDTWEAQVLGPDGLALSAVVNTADNLNAALVQAFAAAPAFVLVRHRLLRAVTTDAAQARFTYVLV